jgi:tetratricopeptide (TPR) repeat protein
MRILVVLAAIAAAGFVPGQRATDLLDLYLKGEHEAAVAPLAKASNAGAMARGLASAGEDWAARGATPGEIDRRRLATAALALEFVVLRMEDEWYTLRPLIEWACVQLLKGAPSDRELAWHRAALAAIQGARDNAFARRAPITRPEPDAPFSVDHVAHVAARFPSDPAVLFAQAFFAEFQVPVEGRMRLIDIDTAATASDRAIALYRRAGEDPALRHEAALAVGYIHLRMKRTAEARAELAVAAESPDPFVRYLAHLFRGRALSGPNASAEAEAAYRAALEAIPYAQSASIALAGVLHLSNRPEAAIQVMNASFAARPAVDPWREYGFGQFRHWIRYRDLMREAVR